MNKSEQMNELVTALVGFHKEVGKIVKNAKNPFFKSSYGDLNSYLAEIREPLYNNGLVLIQLPITNGLTTTLAHSSGQFISETMEMQPSKNDPQGQGSALTYMRRYSLASVLNLNAEDDDGNDASKKAPKQKSDPKALEEAKIMISEYVEAPELKKDMETLIKNFVKRGCIREEVRQIGLKRYAELTK